MNESEIEPKELGIPRSGSNFHPPDLDKAPVLEEKRKSHLHSHQSGSILRPEGHFDPLPSRVLLVPTLVPLKRDL